MRERLAGMSTKCSVDCGEGLTGEMDKHARPWKRVGKGYVLCHIKLSREAPNVHLVEDPSQDQLRQSPLESALQTLRRAFYIQDLCYKEGSGVPR